MANISAFYETKNTFSQYTLYDHPLTFAEWDARPREQKSALLFVQFYNSIVAAWDSANSYNFIAGEDGVSIVCQYLEKNVAKIEENPARFTASYIYRVAYNCMYCICHDLKSVKDRWDNETSAIVIADGSEIDLLEAAPSGEGSAEDVFILDEFREKFWQIVNETGIEAQKVTDYLLSGDPAALKKVRKNNPAYAVDPLRDVEVSLDKVEEILEQLRQNLRKAGMDYARMNLLFQN